MRKVFNQKRLRKWETTAGICCFVAGLVAPVLGGLLAVVEWIVGSAAHPWLHVVSTALFVVGIPLILFAGFCLDWAEREQKKSLHNPDHARRGALHEQTLFNAPTTDILERGS